MWPLLGWLHGEPNADGVLALRAARFVAGPTAQPPMQTASGELRMLPDDWRHARRDVVEGWYELDFDVARANDEDCGVYVPAVAMNAAAYLDREPIGDGGRFDEPVARNWSRPLLWTMPGMRLSPGPHRLQVRVRADRPDTGLLGPVYVGPTARLAPLYARRHALKTQAVWVITLCLVIVGVFTAALWSQSREAAYGWFALAAFAWAAIHLGLLVVNPPLDTLGWSGCWYLALVAWVVALSRFLLAFLGADAPRVARAVTRLGLAGVAVLGSLLLVRSRWLHAAAQLWITAALPVLAFAVASVLRVLGAAGGDLAVALPHVLGLTVVGCALHDWLVFVGAAGPTYDYFLPYAAPPVFLGMTWALLRRFVGALEESDALVADLERRVAAKRGELAESYERLQSVERARVLAEERERIMREMHDGLGSHLVSTLALLEGDAPARDAVAAAVRGALDDLRLMIDALVPLDGDLLGALAMLRARLQPRLEAAGVRVEWRVADLPPIPNLGAPKVLEILRILQEAVTNVLKHAGARTLTVRTTASNGTRRGVAVEIADDGRGFAAGVPAGRGLQHMRHRAHAIGASLDVDGGAAGARVRLRIPLDEDDPA